MKIMRYCLGFLLCLTFQTYAKILTIDMFLIATSGQGNSIGNVIVQDSPFGLLITPNLTGLTPGIHGFHLHENPSCENNAEAAGGHFDPMHFNKHLGPYVVRSHLGDLPALNVMADGSARLPILAPRLKVADFLKGHALVIHEGGDTYSDKPQLGGGGGRIACGVIVKK